MLDRLLVERLDDGEEGGSNSVSVDGSVESEADWVSESMVGTTDVLMDGWMDKSNGGSLSGSMETKNGWMA